MWNAFIHPNYVRLTITGDSSIVYSMGDPAGCSGLLIGVTIDDLGNIALIKPGPDGTATWGPVDPLRTYEYKFNWNLSYSQDPGPGDPGYTEGGTNGGDNVWADLDGFKSFTATLTPGTNRFAEMDGTIQIWVRDDRGRQAFASITVDVDALCGTPP